MSDNTSTTTRKRIVIKLTKCSDLTFIDVQKLVNNCNKKSYGRELEIEDLFSYWVKNCTEKEIKAIQLEYLNPWDKVKKLYISEVQEKGIQESFEDFVARKMKV